MTVATLAYSTSSRRARVLDRIAHVVAASRIHAERAARQARADRIEADLVAEFGAGASFGVKVCDVDAKWRAQYMTASWVAWLLVTVGDVEFWPMVGE